MDEKDKSTQAIYDSTSSKWTRNEKCLLSDFTARPYVLEKLQPLAGRRVLDLGCGEGFVARQIKAQGAASLLGIDLSVGMIDEARAEEKRKPQGIDFRQGDAAALTDLEEGSFDRIVAVFLFNYLDSAAMSKVMGHVFRLLAPGGRFVFTVPHPSFPFMHAEEPPFFFQRGDAGYFSGKDRTFEGSIWRRDGVAVSVRCVHKPLEVYFLALSESGWNCMPEVMELRVQEEDIDLDAAFFKPLVDVPLHLLFSIERKGE